MSSERVPQASKERYLRQKQLLVDLQAQNEKLLKQMGIVDRAWEALPSVQRENASEGSTRVVVCRFREPLGSGGSIERAELCFITYDPKVKPSSFGAYVPVAESFGGTLIPKGGFSAEEASLVESMVASLEAKKAEGLLPDLAEECIDILDNPGAINQTA